MNTTITTEQYLQCILDTIKEYKGNMAPQFRGLIHTLLEVYTTTPTSPHISTGITMLHQYIQWYGSTPTYPTEGDGGTGDAKYMEGWALQSDLTDFITSMTNEQDGSHQQVDAATPPESTLDEGEHDGTTTEDTTMTVQQDARSWAMGAPMKVIRGYVSEKVYGPLGEKVHTILDRKLDGRAQRDIRALARDIYIHQAATLPDGRWAYHHSVMEELLVSTIPVRRDWRGGILGVFKWGTDILTDAACAAAEDAGRNGARVITSMNTGSMAIGDSMRRNMIRRHSTRRINLEIRAKEIKLGRTDRKIQYKIANRGILDDTIDVTNAVSVGTSATDSSDVDPVIPRV